MSLSLALAVVFIGFASGVVSGMFGVGGAILTTPGVRLLGASPIEAVGSTMPAIIPGALSGAWRYAREGLVEWRIALSSGVLGSAFAVGGAELSDHVNAHYLMLMTAGLLLYSGLRNVRATVEEREAELELELVAVGGGAGSREGLVDESPAAAHASMPVLGLIGASSGLLAGLLGVGGGLLLMPAYTVLLRLPPKRAVATSLAAVSMFSVPAMVTHALLGHINWAFALALVVGVVPGAQVGAHFTIRGSENRLRLLTGLFFTVLALVYGGAELAAL